MVSQTSVTFLKELWPQAPNEFATDAHIVFILPQPFIELATFWQVFPRF